MATYGVKRPNPYSSKGKSPASTTPQRLSDRIGNRSSSTSTPQRLSDRIGSRSSATPRPRAVRMLRPSPLSRHSTPGKEKVLGLSTLQRYGASRKTRVRVHRVVLERTAWAAMLAASLLVHGLLRLVQIKAHRQVDIIIWGMTIVTIILECWLIMVFIAIAFINMENCSSMWRRRLRIITKFCSWVCVLVVICELAIACLTSDIFGARPVSKSTVKFK